MADRKASNFTLQTTTATGDSYPFVRNSAPTGNFRIDFDNLAADINATAPTAPIYPNTLIPFGDGSTAGGITNSNLVYDTADGIFNAGFNNTNLSINGAVLEYNSNDPWMVLDGSARRFQIGDLTFDFFGTWIDINDDSASQNITLHANNGVIVNNLAGNGAGLVGVDNTGLLSFQSGGAVPIYPTTQIVYGDGTTAGGVTDGNFIRNVSQNTFYVNFGSAPMLYADETNKIYGLGAGQTGNVFDNGTYLQINDSTQIAGLYGLYGSFAQNPLILADFTTGSVNLGAPNGGNGTGVILNDTLQTFVVSGTLESVTNTPLLTLDFSNNFAELGTVVAGTSTYIKANFNTANIDINADAESSNIRIGDLTHTTAVITIQNQNSISSTLTNNSTYSTGWQHNSTNSIVSFLNLSNSINTGISAGDQTIIMGALVGGNGTNYTLDDANTSQILTTTFLSGQVGLIQTQTNLLGLSISGVALTSTVDSGASFDGILTGDFTNAGLTTQTTIIGHLDIGGGQQANTIYSNDGTAGIIQNQIHDASGNQMQSTLQLTDGFVVKGVDTSASTQSFGVKNNNGDYALQIFNNQNITSPAYISTRDDSGSFFPVSFFYPDTVGNWLVAPLSAVIPTPTTPTLSQVLGAGDTNSNIPIIGNDFLQSNTTNATILFNTGSVGVIGTDANDNPYLAGSFTNNRFSFDANNNAIVGDTQQAYGIFDNTDSLTKFYGKSQTLSSVTFTGSGVNDLSPSITGSYNEGGSTTFTITLSTVSQTFNLTSVVGTFSIGDTVTGNISGASGVISAIGGGNVTIQFTGAGTPQFNTGEPVTDTTSGATGVNANFVSLNNTYDWIDTNGHFGTDVPVVNGTPQLLASGVSITYASDYGHTLNDQWAFTVMPAQQVWAQYDGVADITQLGSNGTVEIINGATQTIDLSGTYNSVPFASLLNIQYQFGSIFIGDWNGAGNGTVAEIDDLNSTVIINCNGLEYFFLDGPNHAVDFGVFSDITTLNFNGSIVESGNASTTYGGTLNYAAGFAGKAWVYFSGGTGASGVLLPTTTVAAIGAVFTVDDGDGSCSVVNTITIDAGSGNTILGTTAAQTYIMNQAGQSTRLRKITNSLWKVE